MNIYKLTEKELETIIKKVVFHVNAEVEFHGQFTYKKQEELINKIKMDYCNCALE